ncbi:MAG: AraC family transcriptional regulator [Burkholderiales bacterium]
MAVLDTLLEVMRPRGAVVGCSWMRSHWGIAFDRAPFVRFNIVLDGHCWVRSPQLAAPVKLDPGGLVLILGDTPHELSSAPRGNTVPIGKLLPSLREQWRRDGFPSHVHAGDALVLHGAYFSQRTLLSAWTGLPSLVQISARDGATPTRLEGVIASLRAEIQNPGPGTQVVIDRLVDLLLVYSFRAYRRIDAGAGAPWIVAAASPALGRGLDCIHRSPEKSWSVRDLALEAGMSRSAFSSAFRRTTGRTPAEYLTNWRMSVAMRLLRETRHSISRIASECGYKNPYAFSTAFRKRVGEPPTRYRRSSASANSIV